jgi:hypothetical protein
MPKTFAPKVETIEGRLAIRGRSGAVYFLDDYDTVDGARKAAYDQPVHWTDADADADADAKQIKTIHRQK